MNPARIAIIGVAIVAALFLALIVHAVSKPKAPTVIEHVDAQAAPPMIRVLTAKTDMAVGDRLSAENIVWQPWPAATLNPAYITDGAAAQPKPQGAAATVSQAKTTVTDIATGGGPKLQAMIGDIVKESLYAGEPITDKKIVRAGDSSYMAVRLPEGMLAMSVPVSLENGAGGFIQPGDRIDVLSSHPDASKNGGGGMITETVLSNVQVLAVDQRTDQPKAGATAAAAGTLTLEVPAYEAETVARAKTAGGLIMALRSYADTGGGPRGPSDGHAVRIFKGGAPAELVVSR
jgi:pilus assembly protein CpaB